MGISLTAMSRLKKSCQGNLSSLLCLTFCFTLYSEVDDANKVNGKGKKMKTAPNRQPMITKLVQAGWSMTQANQLAWADFWEYGRDGRGTGGYSFGRRFHVFCKDCGKGNDFAAADSARLFVQNHKGHRTTFFSK